MTGYAIVILLSYLLGSSSMALYLSKWKKVNLRSGGSKNLGASNTTLLLGWKAGALVALHDILKGVAAVMIAKWVFPQLPWIGAVAGVSCVLGHIFPFYLKFKGGKGFAAYLGMLLALNWKAALVIFVAVVVVTLLTDYIVAGTTLTVLTVPCWLGVQHRSWLLACILCIASLVILYKHRENYVRIYNGTEAGLRGAMRGDHRQK